MDLKKSFFNFGKLKKVPKMSIFQKHLHSGATYMQKQRIHGTTVQVDFPHATSDSAEH